MVGLIKGAMMRTFFYPVIFAMMFFLMMGSVNAHAQEKVPPDVLLKKVTQELITALRKHDKELREQPNYIYVMIDQILVPYVDWHTMAQWVIGRQAWAKATPEQRMRFANEFKDLLIRTYASTLRAYNNQTIEYFPIRGGLDGKERVIVASRIREPGREPIKVSYRMVNKGDSWKVYDISIEGVSLLKGFQSQFAEEIQQHGLNPLIQRLHQHNEKPLR